MGREVSRKNNGGSRLEAAEGRWTRIAGMTGIVGVVLAVLMPDESGCQGLRSLQPDSPPSIAAPSSSSPPQMVAPSTTVATEAPPPVVSNSPPATTPSSRGQRPGGSPPPSPVPATITPPQPFEPPSYSDEVVRLEAPGWCNYRTLDVETRVTAFHEATGPHGPEVDLRYDDCGDGAKLTLDRTNGQALGYSSAEATTADQCRQDAGSSSAQSIQDIRVGLVFCLVTNEGGIARITTSELRDPYGSDGTPTLWLTITYWS